MKTLTTTMILSVMFLSAGAFAGNKHLVVAQPQTSAKIENVTVIMKNGVWPIAGQISVDPCNVRRCIDI